MSSVDFTRFADALGIDARRILGVHQGGRPNVTVFYAPEIHEGPDAPIHVSRVVRSRNGKLAVVAPARPAN
jgi:hypothetical protein